MLHGFYILSEEIARRIKQTDPAVFEESLLKDNGETIKAFRVEVPITNIADYDSGVVINGVNVPMENLW